MVQRNLIDKHNDIALITGANGFIGAKVVEKLLDSGFNRLRCFVRPSSDKMNLNEILKKSVNTHVEIFEGNLLSSGTCNEATRDIAVIFHLAAGIEKSFAGSYMNSVLTTRNLLESIRAVPGFKRFVNVSSFSVYSNYNMKSGQLLDESCEMENRFQERYEPYCFGKAKQDEVVIDYGRKYNMPYVIVRPGAVYGPGAKQIITSRVGIDTFGLFLHLGGSNRIPVTFIDNCATAVVLSGITTGIDGEVFNIVDDELPTSRQFLKSIEEVEKFPYIYIPYNLFYLFCYLWEKYSSWSNGQLPPVFNRRRCSAYWKRNRYSNEKLKSLLDWKPQVSFDEGMKQFIDWATQERGSA